jgi:hypothetical protein
MLGVTRKTVANWTNEKTIQTYLSDSAKRNAEDGTTAQREFTQDDVWVLNTVRLHKTRINTWADIARLLEQGVREMQLPASAMLVETITNADKMELLVTTRQELEIARARIDDLSKQLEKEEEERKAAQKHSEELREEIGKWKALYNLLKEQLDGK